MKSIKVTLNSNKTFNVENLEDVRILEDENNATVIEVQFPSDYEEYSKRVDFLNIRNEKWTTSLYAPEDEKNQYGQDFDRLNFRFTIPSAMAKRGELQIQFVAYLADGTDTIVPFQVLVATINKSIIYATKQGKENPELIIKAYEYSNNALSLSREALDKTANSERAALESEKSAKSAEQSASEANISAKNAQTSAKEANTRATNAETSASEAQSSAKYAESVSNTANTKSDNAVSVSNDANIKSDNAVTTSNNALTISQDALSVANTSNTKADKAVSTANSANTKSETAIETANSAKETAEQALNQVVEKMGTKVYLGNNEIPEADLNFTSDPQNQINTNKTLAENNKTRLDNHDIQLSNHATKLTTHDNEINSAKTRLTNLENQPVITKILYDEDENAFEFKGKWKSDSLELQGGFTALKKIGGGFMISDEVNVGMELGRKDGTAGTPYFDFHTDGKDTTDFNSRILAKGNGIYVTANDGLFLNNWKTLALRNKTTVSTTITMTGGTSTRTYTRNVGIIDLNSCAIVTFAGLIDPAYASNQGSWYTFVVNIPASALSGLKSRGFSTAFSLSYSLLQADGSPMNDYTNSQVESLSGVTYSDSGGLNIEFGFKRYYSENTANHDLNVSILIV